MNMSTVQCPVYLSSANLGSHNYRTEGARAAKKFLLRQVLNICLDGRHLRLFRVVRVMERSGHTKGKTQWGEFAVEVAHMLIIFFLISLLIIITRKITPAVMVA